MCQDVATGTQVIRVLHCLLLCQSVSVRDQSPLTMEYIYWMYLFNYHKSQATVTSQNISY